MQISGSSYHDRQEEFMKGTGQQSEMDKNAFLTLLITQLRHQDPLNPKDNGEFMAQMAQFSSLEQMQNINGGLSDLAKAQEKTQAKLLGRLDGLQSSVEQLMHLIGSNQSYANSLHFSLLGKEAVVLQKDKTEITGKISAVKSQGGEIRYVINDVSYSLDQIVKVKAGD